MSLSIVTEVMPNNVNVLRLVGRITQGEGAKAFKGALAQHAQSPDKPLVLDLSGVAYIDSTGVAELVSAFVTSQKTGQRIVLAALTQRLKDLLNITKLASVFEVYESVEAAKDKVGVR